MKWPVRGNKEIKRFLTRNEWHVKIQKQQNEKRKGVMRGGNIGGKTP